MAKPKLDLYLDVVSPFAYLAFYLVHVSNTLIIVLLRIKIIKTNRSLEVEMQLLHLMLGLGVLSMSTDVTFPNRRLTCSKDAMSPTSLSFSAGS